MPLSFTCNNGMHVFKFKRFTLKNTYPGIKPVSSDLIMKNILKEYKVVVNFFGSESLRSYFSNTCE